MENLKEAFLKIESQIKFHQAEVDKFTKARNALRAVCQHDWQYGGHGHNDDYYDCTICGATEAR